LFGQICPSHPYRTPLAIGTPNWLMATDMHCIAMCDSNRCYITLYKWEKTSSTS